MGEGEPTLDSRDLSDYAHRRQSQWREDRVMGGRRVLLGNGILALGMTLALAPLTMASASQQKVTALQKASGHEFKATLTVTGAVKKTEKFTEDLSVLPKCSVLATGSLPYAKSRSWSLPAGGSTSFSLNWNVSKGYKGPGTYTNPKDFQDSVELDASAGQFDPVSSSVLSVKVNANGSGKATFKNLQDAYTNASVSGTETWTCS
jgi:hypothetical protein